MYLWLPVYPAHHNWITVGYDGNVFNEAPGSHNREKNIIIIIIIIIIIKLNVTKQTYFSGY